MRDTNAIATSAAVASKASILFREYARPTASGRSALLDAIDLLPDTAPLIRQVERFDDLNRAVVDLTFAEPAGSETDYSVQLEQIGETDWRVTGFHGPGVLWPPRKRPRGSGLSTRPDR